MIRFMTDTAYYDQPVPYTVPKPDPSYAVQLVIGPTRLGKTARNSYITMDTFPGYRITGYTRQGFVVHGDDTYHGELRAVIDALSADGYQVRLIKRELS